MYFDNFDNLSYYSQHFRISEKMLKQMLQGKHGEKKQLLGCTILNWDKTFIDNIINGVEMQKLDDIDYFDESLAEETFEYRKNQFKTWQTKQRKDFIKCLIHTPVCLTYHEKAYLLSKKSLKSLLPIPKKYKFTELHCKKCLFYNNCKELQIKDQ